MPSLLGLWRGGGWLGLRRNPAQVQEPGLQGLGQALGTGRGEVPVIHELSRAGLVEEGGCVEGLDAVLGGGQVIEHLVIDRQGSWIRGEPLLDQQDPGILTLRCSDNGGQVLRGVADRNRGREGSIQQSGEQDTGPLEQAELLKPGKLVTGSVDLPVLVELEEGQGQGGVAVVLARVDNHHVRVEAVQVVFEVPTYMKAGPVSDALVHHLEPRAPQGVQTSREVLRESVPPGATSDWRSSEDDDSCPGIPGGHLDGEAGSRDVRGLGGGQELEGLQGVSCGFARQRLVCSDPPMVDARVASLRAVDASGTVIRLPYGYTVSIEVVLCGFRTVFVYCGSVYDLLQFI